MMDDEEFDMDAYEEYLNKPRRFPQFCVINVPFLDMRQDPEHSSEMVSQAMFSEEIRIITDIPDWYRVETLKDKYRGWALKQGAYVLNENSPLHTAKTNILTVNRLSAHVYRKPETIYGPFMTLPFESRLVPAAPIVEGVRWLKVYMPDGSIAYIQRGDVSLEFKKLDFDELCRFSLFFLGIPYTWGGRTSFGYDCSGFVQMLYRQAGINLDRDSKDQFNSPDLEDADVETLEPGDLIFYGSTASLTKHVGMSLGDGKFIHTSAVTENKPYVRISSICDPAWNGKGYYPYMFGKTLKKHLRES